jgi:signal transduction histidine kinase
MQTTALPSTASRVGKTLIHLTLDLWVAIGCMVVWTMGLSLTVGLAITVVGGAIALAVTLAICMGIGRIERIRAAAFLDTTTPAPTLLSPNAPTPRFGILGRYIGSRAAWSALGYVVVKSITGIVFFAIAVTVWSTGVALVCAPIIRLLTTPGSLDLGFTAISTNTTALFAAGVGVGTLAFIAPAVTLGMGTINKRMVTGLLGANQTAQLQAKVVEVSAQRTAAVDGAEAERRRIERDLHDGAQQRLVALGMTIGLAKDKLDSDPEKARTLLDEAHTEAKAAMTELRSIARGIHPAVLEDRGLDAALSAIAARAPIPVRIRVQLPERLGPTIEGAAYYVVSESLTNIAKHAHATEATVTIHVEPRIGRDVVLVTVTDNGSGGAGFVPGGGLAGLHDRVAAIGGTFRIDSPAYGPTTLVAEIPR